MGFESTQNFSEWKNTFSTTQEWLKERLYTRLKEQWKEKIPLISIREELEKHPKVSFLYSVDKSDSISREGTPVALWEQAIIPELWFILDDEHNIPKWTILNYLTFVKEDGWARVYLNKVQPSTAEWLVWVKKLKLNEFVEFVNNEK